MRVGGAHAQETVSLLESALDVVSTVLCLAADGSVSYVKELSASGLAALPAACREHHWDRLCAHVGLNLGRHDGHGPQTAGPELRLKIEPEQDNVVSLELFREQSAMRPTTK